MSIKKKLLISLVIFIFSITFLLPANLAFTPETSSDSIFQIAQGQGEPEIFDTGRLIPYYECPYSYTIDVRDGFTKVEILHYGEDGEFHKFGGWKAYLEVNGTRIYEWVSFTEGEGSYWYDFTDQTYYDDHPANEYTDITKYIQAGENTITFYHFTEGPGAGVIVKVYYGSTGEEETYTEETIQEETYDDYTEGETYQEEDYSTMLQEEKEVSAVQEELSAAAAEDEEKLIFNFKSMFLDPDNPGYVLGREIPGITEGNLKEYQGTTLYKKLIGPSEYITAANSWEDIARLAIIESKVHYNYSQNLGYFKSLYNILSVFYMVQSFRESLRDIPKQFNSLKSVDSARELLKHKGTIIDLSSNLTGIYDTLLGIDKEGATGLGFPELDSKVMFVIGAVSSGGWSVLGDISKQLFIDNAQFSINYEINKAVLNSSLAYHAQMAHELAAKENIDADEINEFFFHVRRVVVLKQLDTLLNMEDSVSLWQENPDLVTSVFDFFNIIDAAAALDADLQLYDQILTNYENAENFLQAEMSDLGLQWQY
jgi:hypothetical protein